MNSERSMYLNGNYVVSWTGSGRKLDKRCLRAGEEFSPEFPDSIDLKVTNRCSWGCPYCHESSTPDGNSFDLEKTKEILSQLPELPIEIAMGGGDVLDCPKIGELIDWLNNRNNLTRATVNIKDILKRRDEYKARLGNVQAVGVSMDTIPKLLRDFGEDESIKCTLQGSEDLFVGDGKAYVIHIIAGIFPYQDLEKLFNVCEYPVLILGYKQWGRARDTQLPKDFQKFKDTILRLIVKLRNEEYDRFIRCSTVGFDNLALEQLGIKDILPEDEWNRIYMGDEGTHSMYIDAVKGEFAMTSRSENRVSWDSIGLIDYFQNLRKK